MSINLPSNFSNKLVKSTEKLNFSSTHAQSMVEEGVLTAREANMRADALCMDHKVVESVIGEDIANVCKDQARLSKSFITDDEIKKLPEFKEFLAEYMTEKGRIYQTTLQQENEKKKKELVASIGISPDLQAKKEKINRVKTAIRTLISEKDEKSRGNSFYMSYLVGTVSEETKLLNVNIIYDYLYESLATPNEKKRRKTNEDAYSFYKRIGPDYSFTRVRERLNAEEAKINSQIGKQKTKGMTKLAVKPSSEQNIVLDQSKYEEEALMAFCATGILEDRYYLQKDQLEMAHVQNFFKESIQKTKNTHDTLIVKENNDKKAVNGVLLRQGNEIIVSSSDYINLQVNQKTIKNYFLCGDRTIKGYLFDRLIECVGYDILDHRIRENLSRFLQYKGADFELYKTEMLDDTFAKADYVMELYLPNTKNIEIAMIDLFVSDKSKDSTGYIQKHDKAKEPKIPYQTYMNLLLEKKYDSLTMRPFKRFVEQQSPKEVHELLLKIIKEPGFSIQRYLSEQTQKKRLLGKSQEKDIVGEMRKISA